MRCGDVADPGRPLGVLTLTDRPIVSGGGERMASTIAAQLDPEQFDRVLCSTRPETVPTMRAELEAAGVEVMFLDRRSKTSLGAWAPLVSLLRSGRIDVLHAHKFGSNCWGTALGRLTRVPVVVAHEHSWTYVGHPVRKALDRHLVGRGADAFIAVSREDARRMVEVEHVDPSVVRYVPNGIPPLPRPTHDVRAELGIPADAPLVGTVGQLRPEKAYDLLLRSVAILARDRPTLHVLIVGEGPERPHLEALVRELGLSTIAHLPGQRRDIANVLAAMDVAVCCSPAEGSPLSVMEYMAAGVAVVATRVGGIPDLVTDGEQGLLVPPDDAVAVARAIGDLVDAPDRRAAMGAAGRMRQARDFDLQVMIERIQDLYRELYARNCDRRGRNGNATA
jgi:glycosyltransferase involved in cell wall biosynthesis